MSQSYSHEEYWTTQSYYFNFIEINNYILCSTSTESFTSKQKHEEISLYVWCTVFITQNVCVCVCSYSNWLTYMVYALLIALVTPCLLLEDLNGVLVLHIQLQTEIEVDIIFWHDCLDVQLVCMLPSELTSLQWPFQGPVKWLTSFKQLVTTFLVGHTQNSLLYCQLMDASVDSNCIHQLILRLPQFKCTHMWPHILSITLHVIVWALPNERNSSCSKTV